MPFGLTFLTPIAGLIAAGVAIPVFLSLYFLKLRRRPVRVSSTLLWRSAAQDLQVNTPFRMIRNSWLLWVQLLLLGLLLLAMAGPAIGTGGGIAERVVVIVDRSASMSARDSEGGRTRLEESLRLASALIDRSVEAGNEVMVIAFADEARVLESFTSDGGRLGAVIEGITPTDQPGDLDAALRLAEAFLVSGEGERSERSAAVVLFSDGHRAAQGSAPPPLLPNAEFRFVRTGPESTASRSNMGVTALSARRDYDDPAVLRLFARVLNAGGADRAVTLRVTLGEFDLAERIVSVPAGGESPAAFDLRPPSSGTLTVTIEGAEDAMPTDDSASLIVRARPELHLALVQPGGRSAAAALALGDALSALDPDRLDRLSPDEYAGLAADPGWLSSVDLIVFDRVEPVSVPPVPTLSFASGLPVEGVLLESVPEAAGLAVGFGIWERTHPLLRFASLGDVRFAEPLRVVLPGDAEPDAPDGSGGAGVSSRVLAAGEYGPVIALLEDRQARRAIVGVDLGRSNWWRDLSFPVFIANAVDYLGGQGDPSAAVGFATGELVRVRDLRPDTAHTVTAPDGTTSAVQSDSAGRVSLGLPERAGLYRLSGAGLERTIAVNLLSSAESSLVTADAVSVSTEPTAAGGIDSATPLELWRWLILAAGILSLFEWMLYARKMRV